VSIQSVARVVDGGEQSEHASYVAPAARVWRSLLVAAVLLVVGSVGLAVMPYRARGSFEHSPPVVTATIGCDQDGENAHPSGSPIKANCEHAGRIRVGVAASGLVLGSLLALSAAVGISRSRPQVEVT